MLNDEPTLPNLHDEATLPNVRRVKPERPPTWPVPSQRVQQAQPSGRSRQPHGWLNAVALGAGVILLLSLFSLLSLLSLTSHSGIFSSGKSAAQSSPGSSAPGSTHGATSGTGWLQVAPTSVQFGCADHQRTQTVVLVNRGPSQIHWQVSFSAPADQASVNISPGNGDLGPGESTAIQLQSATQSAGQQEAISFTATNSQAGPPASLSFTTAGCN
jgi:hypothetical protein